MTFNLPRPSLPHLVVFILFLIWLTAILLAPVLEPAGTITFSEDGRVGIPDYQEKIDSMNGFSRAIYRIGDVMCHLKPSRSLFLLGNQFPFCARCFGIFLGMAIGAGVAVFKRMELKWWWIFVGLIPIAIDGGLQLITSYESNNPLRLITGGLAGGLTAIAISTIIWEIRELFFELRQRIKNPS